MKLIKRKISLRVYFASRLYLLTHRQLDNAAVQVPVRSAGTIPALQIVNKKK